MIQKSVGIDALQFAIPSLYLPIPELAVKRNIEPAKLVKGLGLMEMAVCDYNQDATTLAADAAWKVIEENDIQPSEIGRLYLGTESAVDAAKPTATYVLGILESRFEAKFGKRSMMHCDAVDMTFACVGGVDAFQNALDWIRLGENRKALVIASDVAKYDPNSAGEYTQGAGAVALWLTENPRVAEVSTHWGVAIESVSDFFKPRRTFAKAYLLKEAAKLLGKEISQSDAEQLVASASDDFWGTPEAYIDQFREAPVFDGPYSNSCYQNRVREALGMYMNLTGEHPTKDWNALIFHLPYAFQGRRMWPDIALDLWRERGAIAEIETAIGLSYTEENRVEFVRAWSKSDHYQTYVSNNIADGEYASGRIGNMYTASIFMALISTLDRAAQKETDITGSKIGALSYGSGSKSKVFHFIVREGWKDAANKCQLDAVLSSRTPIDFSTYEKLHQRAVNQSVVKSDTTILTAVETDGNRKGYRLYQ
ncbi:MAG: hydroxymethylglutaryl-CoA synthase family protein [Bacteroidetes bacterium]|nr:MAG: hydroxymethylglutaryl-CoA synthase family protein [Bacteroidota bacterium]